MQITQFYAIILRRNYAIYADITQIIRSHYANKLRNIRRHYAAIYADITQTLHITQIHYAKYTKITQILRNVFTQLLHNITQNYAVITQIVYAQHAIITQISLRRHYANIFCLRNNITQTLVTLRTNYAK